MSVIEEWVILPLLYVISRAKVTREKNNPALSLIPSLTKKKKSLLQYLLAHRRLGKGWLRLVEYNTKFEKSAFKSSRQ